MRRIVDFLNSMRTPWLLAIGAAACMSVFAVWWGGLNQDEGWYLYAAQLVHDGKLPYRDFFFTQGPTMPFVYSALSPLWRTAGSPLHGLLGGRVVTLLFGFAAILAAVALVRRLVPADRRGLAGLAVFAMLGCNLYHLYFVTIPKTYALGGLFVMVGFLLLVRGLESAAPALGRIVFLFAAGLSLAFASGTRISLILTLPVAGLALLARFRTFRWSFLWFGLGGAAGLFITYGLFALDPPSLRALLAAQGYHAARGGFDPFFALGSLSRLLRGYAALGVLGVAAASLSRGGRPQAAAGDAARLTLWALAGGFIAVFLLQISAPFPYDDYQVPVMGMLTVAMAVWFVRSRGAGPACSAREAWFVVLVACGISFVSPLLQDWATYAQDRFWSQRKEKTELAKLRQVGREIECLDPGGKTLLTQDLYLAIETGRAVPPGLEMGPFCYFPDWPADKARELHVMNRELMAELLESAPCPIAACSGYAFAVTAPSCRETPFDEQKRYFALLKKNYEWADSSAKFGQNATTLLVLKRREGKK
ncbi:MAG: hypothetical protein IJ658_13165 [Kiritimatiellae bacterium]|nr:hypothetical protein [Kiritimatiellia bacterium]